MAAVEKDVAIGITNEEGWRSRIALERMPQQAGILHDQDDWTGKSSTAERRKLQNRLHQRLFRERRKNSGKAKLVSVVKEPLARGCTLRSGLNQIQTHNNHTIAYSSKTEVGRLRTETNELQSSEGSIDTELWTLLLFASGDLSLPTSELVHLSKISEFCYTNIQQTVIAFQAWANQHLLMDPFVDTTLSLIKLNVFRALISNSETLGFSTSEHMNDEAISPFFASPNPNTQISRLPPNLHPTLLQCQIPHHPWLDLIPIPEMRDNLLCGSFDEMELCGDLVGFFGVSTGSIGMVIWGEPWDPASWEVTEDFLKRWGWALRGCEKLMQSTNHWRALRSERPLLYDRSLEVPERGHD